jgi:hypothetical protein
MTTTRLLFTAVREQARLLLDRLQLLGNVRLEVVAAPDMCHGFGKLG